MRAARTILTWSLLAHLVGFAAIFVVGCGGGGGGGSSSPVATVGGDPVWSTSLSQVQEALKTAGGTWTAAETSVSLGFSEDEAAALCGMVADPLLSSFTTAVKADIGAAAAVGANEVSLPRRFSWREKDGKDWTSPVKNQGRYGTCVAFAAITALETSLKITQKQSGLLYDLSEWHLWHAGTRGKSPSPGGWFLSGAAEYLKTRGAVSEDLCPYSTIPAAPNPPADARSFAIAGWNVVSGRTALKQALLDGPVVTAMRVRSDFCFYRGGIYAPVAGRELGDHAIVLIGYDDDQNCWIAQNSWSSSWGENGFFRIKYGQINDLGLKFSVSTVGPNGQAAGETPNGSDEAMLGFPNPVVQLGPYVREVTATSAVICWATDQSTTAQVEYGAGPTFSRVAQKTDPAATHSLPLLGLSENTAYQFQVTSTTPTGQTIRSNVQSFITLSVASAPVTAPAIFNVNVSGLTKTSAVISWNTDQIAAGRVYYTTGTIASSASDLRMRTAHSITLSNLQGGTTYSFYVEASGTSLVSLSDTNLFTTLDSTPPVITEVSVPTPSLQGTRAAVVWLTDEPATSQVEYGFSPAYGQLTNLVPTLTYGHQVVLTNLLPQTTYHYRVRSRDANGNEGASTDGTFTTPDSVPPVLSTIRTSPVTGTTATINFTTNETATVQIEYGPGAFTAITAPETNTTFSIVLTGLTPQVVYKYRIRARDAAGNETVTADLQFTTVDTAAPAISNISVPAATLTGTNAEVTWLTDEPATSQVEYGLTTAYGMATTIDTTKLTGHLVKLNALLPNTTYNYRVKSKDVSGNESVSGNNTFTTRDSQPPTISNIRVLPITGTTANITFTTSKSATIVIEYGIGLFSALASTTVPATNHEILLTGLQPKSAYRYRIYATDSSGNVGISAILSFTTLDTVPPVITGIIVSSITNTSATIAWTTDKAATSQVIWGSTTAYDKGPIIDSTLLKNHSIRINLDDSSVPIWNFQVSSTDANGNVATSTNQTFQVPLYLYDVNVTAIGTNSATIIWNSNATASSLVEYGLTSLYGNQAYTLPFPNTGTRNHSVDLSGLVPFATYYFRVRSKDPTGREAMSQGFSFRTLDSGPPIISQVTARVTSNSSAVVTWTTDKNTSAMVEYGTISGTYVSQVVSTLVWSTSQSVALTGLQAGRTYYYRVRSSDSSGNTTVSPEYSFQTSGSSAPLISTIQVVTPTDTTASITWLTDQPASTQVEYAVAGQNFVQMPLDTTLITNHVVALTNLIPYTTYRFRVRSRNAAGLESVSIEQTFMTPDQTPPRIYDLVIQNVTATSATLVWKTDESSDTQVEYGTLGYDQITGLNASMLKNHSVTLTGLLENTTYLFRVKSRDMFNQVGSATGVLTTLDRTAPVLENVNVTNITSTSARISWTTVEAGTSQVEYGTSTGYGYIEPLLPYPLSYNTVHQVDLVNLNPQTTYNFRIRCADAAGNLATFRNFTFTTADTIAPYISGINVTNLTATSATVVWITNEPADSTVNYGPFIPYGATATNTARSTAHAITLTGLLENLTYNFQVSSTDAAGNTTVSDNYSFSTLDRTPPDITNVVATALESSVTITWDTDEEATSKVEWGLTTTYGNTVEVPGSRTMNHTVVVSGLQPFTRYQYRVRSKDALGNERISPNYTFTTLDTLLIQNVTVTSLSRTSARLTWTTNAPAYCEITYGDTNPPGNGPQPEDSLPWGTSHNVIISLPGAVSGNDYYFVIDARTGAGVTASSGVRYVTIP